MLVACLALELGMIQLFSVQLFSRHLGVHSSWESVQRDAVVVGSFTPVSLFVYGDGQFANLSVP